MQHTVRGGARGRQQWTASPICVHTSSFISSSGIIIIIVAVTTTTRDGPMGLGVVGWLATGSHELRAVR